MRIHPKKPETYVVADFTQDVVENAGQDYQLSEGYRWIRPEWYFRLWSAVSFRLVRFFGGIYCRFAFHASIKNRAVLKPYRKTGFYLYGNHTQPFGDVVLPALAVWPKRIYTIGSPANLGIPGLGKLLPAVGILPTPENFGQTKRFWAAVRQRAAEGCCVVTFPEAHVWPYYTEIRPFPEGSFRFPVEANLPAFCLTTTYQSRGEGKKPKLTAYLDGPFFPDPEKCGKDARRDLRDRVHARMVSRSALSDTAYIRYEIRKEEQP